jgi:dipeptidyl-peptidase-4
VTIRDAGGAGVGELPVTIDADLASLELRPTEAVTVKSPGGPLLHGALLKPRKMVAGKRYPAVVMVYGGPGAQTIRDRWSPRLLWQHLADRGVVVFGLDNRGSQGRGPAFAAAIHRNAGRAELEDQLAGAAWLASQPYVDGKRLGIYGHSYGGFMAALAMLSAPGRFAVGVAGSPVTDWRYYDTGYTERYMGTPADNPAGYDGTDLGKKAAGLQGKLFIIHALMDENVHFENTAHLVDALVTANKDFDLLVFPGERHGYRNPAARQYAQRRVVDYFAAHL